MLFEDVAHKLYDFLSYSLTLVGGAFDHDWQVELQVVGNLFCFLCTKHLNEQVESAFSGQRAHIIDAHLYNAHDLFVEQIFLLEFDYLFYAFERFCAKSCHL